jgi:hypothetical protein
MIDDTQEINTHRSNNSKSSDRIILLNLHILCVPSRSKLHILEFCYFFRRVFHILHTKFDRARITVYVCRHEDEPSDRIILLNVNCRSLRSESKRQESLALVDMYKPHIIHATETHLDKQISNAELIDPLLYDIYRKDRLFDPGHEGGGVLNASGRLKSPVKIMLGSEVVWVSLPSDSSSFCIGTASLLGLR